MAGMKEDPTQKTRDEKRATANRLVDKGLKRVNSRPSGARAPLAVLFFDDERPVNIYELSTLIIILFAYGYTPGDLEVLVGLIVAMPPTSVGFVIALGHDYLFFEQSNLMGPNVTMRGQA
jgi:hypothetical protein